MYQVDGLDRVVELTDLPQSSVGAPMPLVMSNEARLAVAYYCQNTPADWDGTSVRVLDGSSDDEPVALVVFELFASFSFGAPNDEAFSGHPLASRGLRPYSAFSIEHSSWIRGLELMNSVHPYHDPAHFAQLRHIVLGFHDTTLECVCRGYRSEMHRGSVSSVVPEMVNALGL